MELLRNYLITCYETVKLLVRTSFVSNEVLETLA